MFTKNKDQEQPAGYVVESEDKWMKDVMDILTSVWYELNQQNLRSKIVEDHLGAIRKATEE